MKRTKIVCTIGPASEKQKTLEAMVHAGMNVARLNMSHGDHDWHEKTIKTIRAVSKKLSTPIGILADLQGPKIRIGVLPKPITLKQGSTVLFSTDVAQNGTARMKGAIPIDVRDLHRAIKSGATILIDDGHIECRVTSVRGRTIAAIIIVGGSITSHKGINLPNTKLQIPSITDKDRRDITFALKQNVDFIALSFVRSANDIMLLKKLLPKNGGGPEIIAKIEKSEAVHNFDSILNIADGIMVARGDLALESDQAQVPLVQKEIINKCRRVAKPVIVATQMLDSMERSPRPTRAEISDVANAVIDHADALMLSGETAHGAYPVQAVATMCDIISKTESSHLDDVALTNEFDSIANPVVATAALGALAAKLTNAKALLVLSHSGYLARLVSKFRPEIPTLLGTLTYKTFKTSTLSWGMMPHHIPENTKSSPVMTLIEHARILFKLKKGNTIVIVSSIVPEHETAIEIKTL